MKTVWLGALCALVSTGSISAEPSTLLPTVPSEQLELETLTPGTCETPDGSQVDLRPAIFGENQEVDILTGEDRRRLRINRHSLTVHVGNHFYPVAELIDGGYDLDLDLKIVALAGRVYVFWRETFLHRPYRQGLLRIVGDELAPFCEGMGSNLTLSH